MVCNRRTLLFVFVFTFVVVSIRFSLTRSSFEMPLSSDFQHRKCQNVSGIVSCKILLRQVDTERITHVTSSDTSNATIVPYLNISMCNMPHNLNAYTKKYVAEDLLALEQFNFLKMYKSPCWKVANRPQSMLTINCMPYFYVIGAPKCATTDLYRRLIQHPEISNHFIKEPHWLNRKHYSIYPYFTDYLQMFGRTIREVYTKQDSSGFHNMIFGDFSASTMWDNDYWAIIPKFKNLSEPLYTNADYIHHLNPKTKIIGILRNPVERLYSDYLYFKHGTPEDFHKSVVQTIGITNECLKTSSLRQCLYTPIVCNPIIKVIRLRIGVYHLHLREYLRVFPRNQVMILRMEHYSNNTVSSIKQIFSFLEISPLSNIDVQKIGNKKKRANSRKAKDKIVGEMLPKTRRLLEEFYKPHNELLSQLLGEHFNFNKDIG